MKRVLVVDDKEENLYYLQALFGSSGFDVELARHGAEALVLARLNPPDLVVSDLLMPVMDGYTLLRHWKFDPRLKTIPFIVYTATYTEPEDERLALGLGADAFILKPAEPEDFLERVREVEENAASATPATPKSPAGDEMVLLKSYSETLIRKLEEKSLLLEAANRELQDDIAERERTQAMLRRSEEELRLLADTQSSILDALPAHIALLDANGFIVSVNEAWRRFGSANLLGSPEFGVGENYVEVCERAEGDCSELAREAGLGIRRVLRDELPEFTLVYPCHSPAEERWFRIRVTPLSRDRGLGAVVMHIDVTDRELIDRRLRRLNRTYAVLSAINQLIVRRHELPDLLQGVCRIAVETGGFRMAWVGLFQPSTLELQAHASQGVVDGYIDMVRADVRDPSSRRGPTARCLLEGKRVVISDVEAEASLPGWRREALRRGFRSSGCFPLRIDGQVLGVLGLHASEPGFFDADELALLDELATDIAFALEVERRESERQRALDEVRVSEERFRELAETIQEVFWVTDAAKSRMLYISPAYEKIWGRTCESLYESPQTWMDSIHPDDRERIREASSTRQVLGGYDETYRIVHTDGTLRWIRDRAFPARHADGTTLRIIGTAEDITDRRHLEEQFRQSQKLEAIGQLAGGVAHDFNNILAAILGNTQLATTEVPDESPARESLEEIRKACMRAKSLVQQVLAFSSQQPQERSVIELDPPLQEAVRFLRASIPSIVELRIEIDPGAPPVLADPTQIHQVVANLCTNAWHALGDQPGRIDVRLDAVELDAITASRLAGLKPGAMARLTVTDTGSGMDATTVERIFEPFFTTKTPGKGTGLGLSVVHGIVQGHDGAIRVSSQRGKGTTFEVYFPAAAAPLPATSASPETPQRGEGQHILYIDDEEPLVFLATRMLDRLGYRASGFTNPMEAVNEFLGDPLRFDLVIVDLNMPGVSGLQVAADLLKARPEVPIALCSGHVTEDLRKRAIASGIREVLYKPNTVAEFSAAIHRLASQARPS